MLRVAAFYPTGARTYVRISSTRDSEGRAAVRLVRRLGARAVYVLTVGDAFDTAWLGAGFLAEAELRGLAVVGVTHYAFEAASYAGVGRRVAASRADALYLLAPTYNRGAEVLDAVYRAGFRGRVVGSRSIHESSLLTDAPTAADRAYFTSVVLPLEALPDEARRFAARLDVGADDRMADEPSTAVAAVHAAEAANVLLDAVAESDGTRAGIRRAPFEVGRAGLLGRISIDARGDVRPQRVAIFQARAGEFVYRRTVAVSEPPR